MKIIDKIKNKFKSGIDKEIYELSKKYNTKDLKELSEYKIKLLDIQKKYNRIEEYDYDIELSKIMNKDKTDNEKKIAELEVMLKHKKITGIEYCKQKNDLLGKPWAAFRTNFDEDANIDKPEIEIVYNKCFVNKLKNSGLPGDNDEEIVDQWLKLFFLAQLESDDLSLLEDTEEEHVKPVKKKKIDNGTTFIV